MDSYRKYAIIAGVLFIIYTSVDILSFLFLGPTTATNYLVSVSENAGLVGTGALLLLVGGACGIGIAISLYPVLKKFNAGLALGAVSFRISEGVLRFVAVGGLSITNNIKPAICTSWSSRFIVFPNLRRIGICRKSLGQCFVAAGFLHRCSAILHHILSNKTSSSMVIGLGSCCRHTDYGIRGVSNGRSHRSILDNANHFESSNITPRNGSCCMADSQRIQSIRNCFQVSSGGIVEQPWKLQPQVEVSDRRHTSSTRSCSN